MFNVGELVANAQWAIALNTRNVLNNGTRLNTGAIVQTLETTVEKDAPVLVVKARKVLNGDTVAFSNLPTGSTTGPTIPPLDTLLAQKPYYNPYLNAPRTYPINGEYRLMHTQPALDGDGKPLPNATDKTFCQTTSAVMGDGRAILLSGHDNCKTQIQYAPLNQGTGNKTKAGNKTPIGTYLRNLGEQAGGVEQSQSSVIPVEAKPEVVASGVRRYRSNRGSATVKTNDRKTFTTRPSRSFESSTNTTPVYDSLKQVFGGSPQPTKK